MSLLKYNRRKKIVPISPTTDIVVVDKNGYIGEKRPNGNTVYFGYLDNFADFSEKGLGQVTIIQVVIGEVTIGGRKYKTTKIGNQEWLAENLDWKFNVDGSQIPIGSSGSPTTPAAWYYSNDESTYGWNGLKYGLLYNWYAAKYLDDNKVTLLPNGWRVPNMSDLEDLSTACYGNSNAGFYLKSGSRWASNGNGVDIYEFTAYPAGHRNVSTAFGDINTHTNYWSSDADGSNARYKYMNYNSRVFNNYSYPKESGFSLRLVKDAS